MDNRSIGRGRHHAAGRLVPILALVLLAAILIWPSGVAQGDTSIPPAASDVSLAQATPGALENQAQLLPEDQSGIYLNKFECQGSFGGDLNALLQNCPVVYNVNFEVFGPNLQLMENGGISLERLPAGLYRIREYIPAGFGDPTAFCGIGPTNGAPPTFTPVVVYDGYYEFELGPSQTIYCNWFNISPQAAPDTATLYINKHFCKPAAELDAYAASIYELAPNCQEPTMPVAFSVTRDGTQIGGGTANGAPDALVLTGLPAGAVNIIEAVPDGFGDPLVFCTVKDEFGAARAPLAQAQTDNSRAFWQLNAGDVVFCDWFNVPEPLGVSISVIKYICPAATGIQPDGYEELAAACTETRADVSFKLDGARTGNPGEQLTDANGQITWADMEADLYFLTEEVPAGFGPPVVYCSIYNPAALMNRVYEAYPVSSENRIELDLVDGQYIACSWFNLLTTSDAASPVASPDTFVTIDDPTTVPDAGSTMTPETPDGTVTADVQSSSSPASDGQATSSIAGTSPTPAAGTAVDPSAPATLTLRTFRCQPGYDFLAEAADPAVDCTDQPDDLRFELSAVAGSSNQGRRLPDIGGEGATFTGLVPGDYRLATVNAPSTGAAFIETCQSDQRDFNSYLFSPFAVVAPGGSVQLGLVAGETLVCDWYDVPNEAGGQG